MTVHGARSASSIPWCFRLPPMSAATQPILQRTVLRRKTCNRRLRHNTTFTSRALQSTLRLPVPGAKKTLRGTLSGRAYCLKQRQLQTVCLPAQYSVLPDYTTVTAESITVRPPPSLMTGWSIFCTMPMRRGLSATRLRRNFGEFSTCTMVIHSGDLTSYAAWDFSTLPCRAEPKDASLQRNSFPQVFDHLIRIFSPAWHSDDLPPILFVKKNCRPGIEWRG